MSDTSHLPWPTDARRLRVGDLEIDLRFRLVVRPDREIELHQRLFELLLLFLAEPHVLHLRAELFRRVWSGMVVEDGNLSQNVWMLRKALGDERKGWIRTVAKGGYVFQPPTRVEAIEESTSAECVTEAMPLVAREPQRLRERRFHRWRRFAAVAAMIPVFAIAMAWFLAPGQAAPLAPLSVTLIDVEDSGQAADARWPVALLHAWLEWKLSTLPEIALLTQAQLAADVPAQSSTQVVLLASGPVPGDPQRIFLRASFQKDGKPNQVQVEGTPARLSQLVDTLSQRVLDQLVPARADQPWPVLKVDEATARRYVDVLRARDARQWVKAAEIGQEVVVRSPEFALARLQLAQTMSTLGQIQSAQEQMTVARGLLRPLPTDAAAVIDAQRLALTPEHEAAAAAYAALAARYPAKTTFALEQARALARAGRFADSLSVLSTPVWEKQPVGTQVSWLLNRAMAELMLGDAARAGATARRAERLAQTAGWEHERGFALLTQAQAETRAHDGTSDTPLYEEAARQFDAAGDTLRALRARLLGATSRSTPSSSAQLDTLLAQIRASGHRRLEIQALHNVAYQHYRAGDLPAYRARREQAIAVTRTIGDDLGLREFEIALLNDDFHDGDFASADQRLARLRSEAVQGEMAMMVDEFMAQLAYHRGRYPEALAALDRAEKRARADTRPGEPMPISAATLGCMRATILLSQGEVSRARAELTRCAASGLAIDVLQAQIGNAEADLLRDDREAAVQKLRLAYAALPTVAILPVRWGISLDLAALLTRAGETETADKLYAEVLPSVHAANFRLLETATRIGMAETAMARSDLPAARAHADAARSLMPAEDWALGQRVHMLDIVIARATGNTKSAQHLLVKTDRAAHQHGDVLAQIRIHGLMEPTMTNAACSAASRAALVARSGLHGATQDWLSKPVMTTGTARLAEAGTDR